MQVFFRDFARITEKMYKKSHFNAIICEYNPFHNGHKYHLQAVKAQNNRPTAVIMSGSFTQRGEAAIADKFTRARLAVENGADLVIELPAVYALGSAQTFARGGVGIAEGMGCVEYLCFSAECGELEPLKKAALAFDDEGFNNSLKEYMDKGSSYPLAVESAMRETVSDEAARIVSEPNNTLAVEYIRAAESLDFIVTKRKGARHDGVGGVENIRSASELRGLLREGKGISAFSPAAFDEITDEKLLGRIILYKLRTMSAEDIKNLPDVSEGLENRIVDAVKNAASVEELLEKVKTKRYTMARLRRILCCALLGITREMGKTPPPYIRALAFNKKGTQIMREIKECGRLPLITNVADGYKNLSDSARRIFDIDILATDIHALAYKKIKPCAEDFKYKLKIIEN